ncbi:MAG: hypothetical protein JST30_13765 [Armatimonadetes bacterium]|nr:hypothetical protein [Armatimonadota bacterium]
MRADQPVCDFLYVFVPDSSGLSVIQDLLESEGLGFKTVDGPSPAAKLPDGTVQILATPGHCSCGTAIGGYYDQPVHLRAPDDKEVLKLKRKGWSDSRIQRWLDEKTAHLNEVGRAKSARDGAELDQWVGVLKGAVDSGATDWIGLSLHFEGGASPKEPPPEPDRRVRSRSLGREDLASLTRDTVLFVTR